MFRKAEIEREGEEKNGHGKADQQKIRRNREKKKGGGARKKKQIDFFDS